MITSHELMWLAGLLEGEGCFGIYKNGAKSEVYREAKITVIMADKDVVAKAADLMGCNTCLNKRARVNRKALWSATVSGARSVGWMYTLYPLMGSRRKARIREIVAEWRVAPFRCEVSYYRREKRLVQEQESRKQQIIHWDQIVA
jgi:hypothetical protein